MPIQGTLGLMGGLLYTRVIIIVHTSSALTAGVAFV